ncbi:MAG: hypothetical protein AAF152_15765 [Cyanobacteria bacterium P01_A01_bin.114]
MTGLDGHRIRALAAGPNALWAISNEPGGGLLWHSADGVTWTAAHRFEAIRLRNIAVYGDRVYVGAQDETGQGVLLGPDVPAAVGEALTGQTLTPQPTALSAEQLQNRLQQLDRVIADAASYTKGDTQDVLAQAVMPLALSGLSEAGKALSERLQASLPEVTAQLFENAVSEPVADVVQWYLLWAIGLNGHSRIPVELLTRPWTTPSNPREKYWQPAPAAAWAVAQVGQSDTETLAVLVNRLSFAEDPTWLKGDFVGALSALTGEQFGYDEAAWQSWWTKQSALRYSLE